MALKSKTGIFPSFTGRITAEVPTPTYSGTSDPDDASVSINPNTGQGPGPGGAGQTTSEIEAARAGIVPAWTIYKNGSLLQEFSFDISGFSGTDLVPAAEIFAQAGQTMAVTAAFTSANFVHSPPDGFSAWDTSEGFSPSDIGGRATLSNSNRTYTYFNGITDNVVQWTTAANFKSGGKLYYEMRVNQKAGLNGNWVSDWSFTVSTLRMSDITAQGQYPGRFDTNGFSINFNRNHNIPAQFTVEWIDNNNATAVASNEIYGGWSEILTTDVFGFTLEW